MNEYDEEPSDPNEAGWVSNLRKKTKETQRENKELRERLEKLEAEGTHKSISRQFASRSVDPRMAKFYTGDGSDESIDKWIEDNDDLLGLRTPKEEADEPSTVKASEQEAFQLLREMANDRKLHIDLESRLKAANDKDELMAIVKEAQALGVRDTY